MLLEDVKSAVPLRYDTFQHMAYRSELQVVGGKEKKPAADTLEPPKSKTPRGEPLDTKLVKGIAVRRAA